MAGYVNSGRGVTRHRARIMKTLILRVASMLLGTLFCVCAANGAVLSINFSATAGPSSFPIQIGFSMPLALSGLVDVSDSLTFTLTDENGDGASLAGFPNPLSPYLQAFGEASNTNLGVDLGGFAISSSPGDTETITASDSNTTTWHSGDGSLSAMVALTLSANDFVNVTGNVTVVPHTSQAPEPATLALLGLGLAGIGFLRRKQ
jgi:PEP-CTERM motif